MPFLTSFVCGIGIKKTRKSLGLHSFLLFTHSTARKRKFERDREIAFLIPNNTLIHIAALEETAGDFLLIVLILWDKMTKRCFPEGWQPREDESDQ